MKLTSILSLAIAAIPVSCAQLRHLQTNVSGIITPQAAIDGALNEIIKIIDFDKPLGYKFVRLGFHDCVGGCDGCVDLLNADNKGLEVAITVLESIVSKFAVNGVTRSDIWALAAMTYADRHQGRPRIDFPFKWYGRPTCEMLNTVCHNVTGEDVPCSPTQGPHRVLPSSNLDTHGILDYFDKTFGFNAQETVALMGAHTLGKVQRANTGFVGDGWDSDPSLLDNAYFSGLVGGNSTNDTLADLMNVIPTWRRTLINNTDLVGSNIPNRHEWQQEKKVMLNSDISLVRDFNGRIKPNGKVRCAFTGKKMCPAALLTIHHVAMYRNNNMLWVEDFRDVFTFMLEFPYMTTGVDCPHGLCLISDLAIMSSS